MLSEGTFPNVGDLAMSRSSPRVGDGFIRLDVDGRGRLRQPERDLGLSPDGADRRTGGPQPRHRHPAADLRPVRGAGAGRTTSATRWPAGRACGWRSTPAARPCCCARCRWWCTARPSGAAVLIRDVTEVKRRDRALLSQGRHHPRDPPPGEEQPADRRRAAAPAGPAHQQRRGPRGADRVGAAGVVDRAGARRAVDVGGRGGQPRRGGRPDPADHERRRDRWTLRSGSTASATSVCSTPTGPPR